MKELINTIIIAGFILLLCFSFGELFSLLATVRPNVQKILENK